MFKFLAIHNSKIFKYIGILYSKIIEICHIPTSWKQGNTILLPKPNNNYTNNWRPITLLNTLYKGFTTIINENIQKLLTENKFFHKNNVVLIKTRTLHLQLSHTLKL